MSKNRVATFTNFVLILTMASTFSLLRAEEPALDKIRYEKVPRLRNTGCLPETLSINIRDNKNVPLPDAVVSMSLNSMGMPTEKANEPEKFKFLADENGDVVITFDKIRDRYVDSLLFEASHGKSYIAVKWAISLADANVTPVIPKKLAVTLTRGKMLKLQISDSDGNAIEAVKAQCGFQESGGAAVSDIDGKTTFPNNSLLCEATTDAEGRCELGPLPFNELLRIGIQHQDHSYYSQNATLKDEDSGLINVTIQSFPLLKGRVFDEEGKPFAKAYVFHHRGNTRSDSNGNFSFRCEYYGSLSINASAPGYHLTTKSVTKEGYEQPIELSLTPAKNVIRIRAEDEAGNPVKNFDVGKYFLDDKAISAVLYDDFWEWSDPPNDEVFLIIGADRFLQKSDNRLLPIEISRNVLFGYENSVDANLHKYLPEKPYYQFRPRKEPYVVKVKKMAIPQADKNFRLQPGFATFSYSQKPHIENDWSLPGKFAIRLSDFETGKPCANTDVTLELCSLRSTPVLLEMTYRTDEQGVIGFDFKDVDTNAVWGLDLTFASEGYTSKTLHWGAGLFPLPFDHLPSYAAAPRVQYGIKRLGHPIPEFMEISIVRKK